MVTFKKRVTVLSAIGITLYVIIVLIPIVLTLLQSFKPQVLMFTNPPTFIFEPTINHYANNFINQDILHYIKNSIIIAAFSTFICLIFGSLCAYALSRLQIPGKNIWALIVLITRMVPMGTLMIPLYTIMRAFGLLGSHAAVIITHATLNLPFTIWMMRSFFDDVPEELEQAALVDGCSRIKSFVMIALPLCAAGLVATGILTVIYSWNEFLFALILSNPDSRTLPVWVAGFISVLGVDWGGSSAAAITGSVPIFIAAVFVQKYLVRGLTMGAVKG